jgi:hypothetical protein
MWTSPHLTYEIAMSNILGFFDVIAKFGCLQSFTYVEKAVRRFDYELPLALGSGEEYILNFERNEAKDINRWPKSKMK